MATSKRRDAPAGPGTRTAVDALDSRAARAAALDALARRDYASEDLRRKLLDKGYDPSVVADLIERLSSEKLVDDRRYVESFISYRAARGQGPHRVRADLRKIGLQGEIESRAWRPTATGSPICEGRAKRSLARSFRPITLISSAKPDFWVTAASRALRFDWL